MRSDFSLKTNLFLYNILFRHLLQILKINKSERVCLGIHPIRGENIKSINNTTVHNNTGSVAESVRT